MRDLIHLVPSVARAAGVLLLVAASAIACDDPVADTQTPAGQLAGRLALAKTGDGVPNAVIALERDGAVVAATATSADGTFSFDRVARGTYDVHLTGLELTPLSLAHTRFEPRSQRVEVNGETQPLLFAAVGLIPARITGIVSCGGQVDPDAAVRIVGGQVDSVVVSNGIGRYALTDLEPGHYAVMPVRAACLDALAARVVHAQVGQYVGVDFDG